MQKILKKVRIKYLSVSLLIFGVLFGVTGAVSAITANTTISSAVGSLISITTNGTVNLDVLPTGAGAQTIASDTATVNTNDSLGYTLTLSSSSAVTALTSGANTIPALTAGTQSTPIVQTVNTWGYCVPSVGGFSTFCPSVNASNAAISGTYKFAGIKASGSGNTIATTNTAAVNATTTIWYAVAANTSQATGTYTNTVTYTATAN